MTNEEICREIVASNAGEAYFKCLTLLPDQGAHPFFLGPMLLGFVLGGSIVGLIAAFAD